MPVMSGMRPHRASSTDSLASGATMRMSAPSAICSPPPSAAPWSAAITGTSSSCHTHAACWPRWVMRPSVSPMAPSDRSSAAGSRPPAPPAMAWKLPKSRPAQNPRPSPDRTTTRTSGSPFRPSPASTMPWNMA